MTTKKILPYGTLPTQEEFERAFKASEIGACRGVFFFGNDPRVGTCALTCSELWEELVKARREWCHKQAWQGANVAGQWCSNVLGALGFEWVSP